MFYALKKKDFSTILFSVIARDNNFCALPSWNGWQRLNVEGSKWILAKRELNSFNFFLIDHGSL